MSAGKTILALDEREMNSIKPLNNIVVLKRVSDNTRISFLGQKLKIDGSYNPEHHIDVVYQVVKPPKELIYDRRQDDEGNIITIGMENKTRMDLREGDIVWVNYNQALNCGRCTVNGELHLFMPYPFIFMTVRPWDHEESGYRIVIDVDIIPEKRSVFEIFEKTGKLLCKKGCRPKLHLRDSKRLPGGDSFTTKLTQADLPDDIMIREEKSDNNVFISYYQVVMLNGYILFEAIKKKEEELLWLPKEQRDRFGIIRYLGRPNAEYADLSMWDDNRPRVGDFIHLAYKVSRKLENPIHALFDKDKEYHITQRRRILGIITDFEKISCQ